MAGKAVISLTTGLEDPEKVTAAFLVAVGAAESGRPTVMFQAKEAVRLALDGIAVGVLHAAHATADQLGARHLRDSCTTAFRQLGDAPRRHLDARRVSAGLTSRELDVMELVSQGNTSRQVGHTLFISPRTVEMHVNSSMQKLQCRTRAEAVRRLTELGALPGPDVVRQEPG